HLEAGYWMPILAWRYNILGIVVVLLGVRAEIGHRYGYRSLERREVIPTRAQQSIQCLVEWRSVEDGLETCHDRTRSTQDRALHCGAKGNRGQNCTPSTAARVWGENRRRTQRLPGGM